jgi:hypothetical protein
MPASNTDIRSTPPRQHEAIVVDVEFGNVSNAIYVGVSGDVELVSADDGTNLIYKNAAQGTYIIGRFKKVNSAGTTATNLINAW